MARPSHASYGQANRYKASTHTEASNIFRESAPPACHTTRPRYDSGFHGSGNSAGTSHTETTEHTAPDNPHSAPHYPEHLKHPAGADAPAYANPADTAIPQYPYSNKAFPKP